MRAFLKEENGMQLTHIDRRWMVITVRKQNKRREQAGSFLVEQTLLSLTDCYALHITFPYPGPTAWGRVRSSPF